MPNEGRTRVAGKGFAPTEPNPADETATMTTRGSGREFAPGVGDPHTDERARQTIGSGKRFASSVHDRPADERNPGQGSGKQFEPGRHST